MHFLRNLFIQEEVNNKVNWMVMACKYLWKCNKDFQGNCLEYNDMLRKYEYWRLKCNITNLTLDTIKI